ncbi:type II toxin-antitoxin system VapB family antitoxin [Phycicoccus sp. CSK15P-2]|uniref:type II toxin-antitoxin system VapB family antitoxin n=1 Tax=Phycicoccus sp. CSK15P-2 TaxID=2807627 RepID=UPI00195261D4|nr:type II toxin-antitoxin system VapB family antitoxin [Phycicoccus sp. CSK15P-2]MBM6404606.1 type II toxin-antitoxin system VapB family antitoxin [Phycicoccus sp. CSK15P-2]
MSLNIKKPRVHELARMASERSGLSQTGAIEAALEQYLTTLDAPAAHDERRRRVTALLADLDQRLTDANREALRIDDLYDDAGLPA